MSSTAAQELLSEKADVAEELTAYAAAGEGDGKASKKFRAGVCGTGWMCVNTVIGWLSHSHFALQRTPSGGWRWSTPSNRTAHCIR